MLLDIRTAALDDEIENRVHLAVPQLAAYKLRARVTPWNGTRCHLLVAAADEKYGHMAILLALRRGTPVIALGKPIEPLAVSPLPRDTTAEALIDAMRARLEEVPTKASRKDDSEDRRPLVCRLSRPPVRGKAIGVRNSERTLMLLRPQAGRAYASTFSDFEASIKGFQDLAWGRVEVDNSPITADMVSTSIESFLLLAADMGKLGLPDYPDGYYKLNAWPDLGSLPGLVSALYIAKQLVNGPVSPDEIVEQSQIDIERQDVNACLWAWAAADLLVDASGEARTGRKRSRQTKQRVSSGMWSSIARRFGLMK